MYLKVLFATLALVTYTRQASKTSARAIELGLGLRIGTGGVHIQQLAETWNVCITERNWISGMFV